MENATYVALAHQAALERVVETTAHDMANMSTAGYKSERLLFERYLQDPAPGRQAPLASVLDVGSYTDFRAGAFAATGNPLDVAIGSDGFLAVATPQGTAYTRDGALKLDDQGQIVTAAGHPVLDGSGSPITLPPEGGEIRITGDGAVLVDGREQGRLGVVRFRRPQNLVRSGDGLYRGESGRAVDEPRIAQGMIERSNVEPILATTRMIDALRNYQMAQQVVDGEHERLRDAIGKLGRTTT